MCGRLKLANRDSAFSACQLAGIGIIFVLKIKNTKAIFLMILIIIFLSVIIILLLYVNYKKRTNIDDNMILRNRFELFNMAKQDWENGLISRNFFRLLVHFFHPDFKNIWDYKPMDTSELRREMYELDNNFWKTYKINPDFALPIDCIYKLYKEYIEENLENYPLIKEVFCYP